MGKEKEQVHETAEKTFETYGVSDVTSVLALVDRITKTYMSGEPTQILCLARNLLCANIIARIYDKNVQSNGKTLEMVISDIEDMRTKVFGNDTVSAWSFSEYMESAYEELTVGFAFDEDNETGKRLIRCITEQLAVAFTVTEEVFDEMVAAVKIAVSTFETEQAFPS